jgi:hypothetical protein
LRSKRFFLMAALSILGPLGCAPDPDLSQGDQTDETLTVFPHGAASDPSAHASGHGHVEIDVSAENEVVSFRTSVRAPPRPSPSGTLFLWPGLQPWGANFQPIGNGVLQPVLTFGPSCAPHAPTDPYASWWVSAQYVNTYGHEPGYTGCLGGPGVRISEGDVLALAFDKEGTHWKQTVISEPTGESVSYAIDMRGQTQNRVEFAIEEYSATIGADVAFVDSSFTMAKPEPASCHAVVRGANDFVPVPTISRDGKTCSYSRIVLRDATNRRTGP